MKQQTSAAYHRKYRRENPERIRAIVARSIKKHHADRLARCQVYNDKKRLLAGHDEVQCRSCKRWFSERGLIVHKGHMHREFKK